MYTIDLDCSPGYPRPSDLLPQVLEGLNIEIDPENTVMRFFGNWRWEIPNEQSAQYEKVREIVKERITALFNAGSIRYGSW